MTYQNQIRVAVIYYCLSVGVATMAAPTPPSTESLDHQLLEGLDAQLLEGLRVPQALPRADSIDDKNGGSLHVPQNREGPLFKRWSDQQGEDLGQPGRQSPLVEIEAAMRAAQELIAQREHVAEGVEIQTRVVADLDKLIQELEKQCAACQGQSSSQTPKPGSRRSEVASSSSSRPAARRGANAAEDSTTRLEQGSAAEVDMAEMQELLKDLWGHLPERVREQLLQAPSDEFLPKYQLEIEKYFRRLAEEGQQDERRP